LDDYPVKIIGMRNEVEDVEKMLRDSTFYMLVSNEKKLLRMRSWPITLMALGIGITVSMETHSGLESVVCRWKPLNAHNMILRSVVITMGC
jgi:hypothetical protein